MMMESGDLKKQFENLQFQQKQKMMERMKSKNQDRSSSSQVSESQNFDLEDDLNLTTADVMSSNIAGLHTALEDANTRMRGEIRELKDETGRLRKQLAEKDYDIKLLNRKFLKLEEDKKLLASAGAVSDTAAIKIVDLSKRNRELTAGMEVEKTKTMKLLKQIVEMERNNDGNTAKSPRKKMSPRNPMALHQEVKSENVDELNDKLQSSYIKMAEYRNLIQELKQELKIASKVLQLEIGEPPASMQLILNSGGAGFRGRSQQIMALQDKVKDLEQKLKFATGQGGPARTDKNVERIKSMEKQRKEQSDELRSEILKANDINAELQRKIDATKARNRVLSSEVKSLKSQIAVLTDKGKHDNELVTTLMKQHENLHRIVEQNVNAKDNMEKAGIVFSKEIHSRQQQEHAEISMLRQLLTERDARLRQLETNIQDLMNGRSSVQSEVNSSPSPTMARQSVAVPVPLTTSQIQQENEPQNRFVKEDGGQNSDLLQQIEDLSVELTRYQALYKTASMEQEQLNEIVNILTKRNEQSTMSYQELHGNLNNERRKTTKLEYALENLKASIKQESSGKEASPSSNSLTSSIPPETKISELKTLLSIQTDENAALKESLESTLRAKQEDVGMFHDMMEQTKSVFVDALRSLSSKNH